MRNSTVSIIFAVSAIHFSTSAVAENASFYLKPHLSLSVLQDSSFSQAGLAAAGAGGDANFDTGWASGLAFGYDYGNGWRAEIDWEYRTNEVDDVNFSDNTQFSEGDFASSIIFLNGYRVFKTNSWNMRPLLGAGVGWVQEIDFDREIDGKETSYSSDGDFAWQIMAGVEGDLADDWQWQGLAKYTSATGIDLSQEGGNQAISDIDYQTWSMNLGVIYSF